MRLRPACQATIHVRLPQSTSRAGGRRRRLYRPRGPASHRRGLRLNDVRWSASPANVDAQRACQRRAVAFDPGQSEVRLGRPHGSRRCHPVSPVPPVGRPLAGVLSPIAQFRIELTCRRQWREVGGGDPRIGNRRRDHLAAMWVRRSWRPRWFCGREKATLTIY